MSPLLRGNRRYAWTMTYIAVVVTAIASLELWGRLA